MRLTKRKTAKRTVTPVDCRNFDSLISLFSHESLGFDQDNLTVQVLDNGKGFDPKAGDKYFKDGHLGLRSMDERAKALKGNLMIESKPGKSTMVKLTVPIDKEINR